MTRRRRIDVHQHLVPPGWAAWLRSRGVRDAGGRELPDWSPEAGLQLLEDRDIATAVLSVSTPGVRLPGTPRHDAEACARARELNGFAARVARDHPGRFSFFATLPLPDVDGALEEARHAFDTLGASGVILLANTQGHYLGDPEDDPLLEGFLPYASHRIAAALVAAGGCTLPEVLEDLRSFYFDTALSGSPAALPSLLAFAKPGHVLFGSDWPYAPALAVGYFTAQLDAYDALDPDGHGAIDRRSAVALFPRLA